MIRCVREDLCQQRGSFTPSSREAFFYNNRFIHSHVGGLHSIANLAAGRAAVWQAVCNKNKLLRYVAYSMTLRT